MEMILQHVAGSQMMSLLDGFSSYNQIKVKRADINWRHKGKGLCLFFMEWIMTQQ
jgi:hypothetical protein